MPDVPYGPELLPLSLCLFGAFDVRIQGEPLPRLRSRKGQWLLALLVMRHGRAVDRGWLAGTLWPDSPESQALYSLRRSLADLRQALGDQAGCLHSPTLRSLCLSLPEEAVDVLVFDAATARGDPASLEKAVGLYHGPLLEGCTEEWVLPERAAREQTYLDALEQLAALALKRADPAVAIGYLRRAIGTDLLRESAQRALMQALAAGGDYAAAVQVYRELRLLLRRELNTDPDPQTLDMFQQIRSEARRSTQIQPTIPSTPPSSPGPRRLPRPITALVGRTQEIQQIVATLRADRLVTLMGPGGIGKTRLALAVAEEVADGSWEGACFVDLAAFTDPTLVLPTVASVLGLREESGRGLLATLQEYLEGKALLLVLDNCEHLIEACARLSDGLLSGCPRLRILATSRQALGLTGEVRWPVPPLSLPASPSLAFLANETAQEWVSRLLEYEAIQLFIERAQQAVPSFRITRETVDAVAQICSRLDGMPLAIELAASRVTVLTVEQIALRLDDRFRLLTGGSRTALPRQQTLKATLDWSYDLLSESERLLLRRVSVFAGGWTLSAAEAVCADFGEGVEGRGWGVVSEETEGERGRRGEGEQSDQSKIPNPLHPDDVLDLLTSLVDKSLVVYEERERPGRYRLLESVQQYAHMRLREAAEEDLLRSRHRDFFLDLAERADPHLTGAEQGTWFARLEADHPNLSAALESCPPMHEGEQALLRLSVALWRYWDVRWHVPEGRKWLEKSLSFDVGPLMMRGRAYNAAGILAWKQRDYAAARAHLQKCLAISEELADQEGAAYALNNLALVAWSQADYEEARKIHGICLTLNLQIDNPVGISASLYNLGLIACDLQEYEEAQLRFQESLKMARERGLPREAVLALNMLGYVAYLRGDYGSALASCTQSLAQFRQWGDRAQMAVALNILGNLARHQRDYDSARRLLEESLVIRRELDNRSGMGDALSGYAALAFAQRHPERAARLWGAEEALRQALSSPLPPNEQEEYKRNLAAVRETLGEEAFAAAWAEGQAMSMEQAIEYALQDSG